MTHPQYLIALNQGYFPTVPSSPRKTVRAPSEIKNIIPDELHLFEQTHRIKDIDKHSSLLILTILVL